MKGKIFNAQEVQAIISGNKRQFREVIKCPYQVGQKIFCKESFFESFSNTYYRADIHGNGLSYYAWELAQHMKQEHSRLTLQIKEIRVERLAEISKDDIIEEGLEHDDKGYFYSGIGNNCYIPAQLAFENSWNATHKKPEEKFEANPWVWAIDFEVVK